MKSITQEKIQNLRRVFYSHPKPGFFNADKIRSIEEVPASRRLIEASDLIHLEDGFHKSCSLHAVAHSNIKNLSSRMCRVVKNIWVPEHLQILRLDVIPPIYKNPYNLSSQFERVCDGNNSELDYEDEEVAKILQFHRDCFREDTVEGRKVRYMTSKVAETLGCHLE